MSFDVFLGTPIRCRVLEDPTWWRAEPKVAPRSTNLLLNLCQTRPPYRPSPTASSLSGATASKADGAPGASASRRSEGLLPKGKKNPLLLQVLSIEFLWRRVIKNSSETATILFLLYGFILCPVHIDGVNGHNGNAQF